MIAIDGSAGEGGGQILRTSLSLALATGKPFRMEKIRAKRPKPGMLRQHLTAVQAATQIGQAQVHGADVGSKKLTFIPRGVRPGEYRFAVGTAGSTTLVLQTVLPALMTASGPSRLTFEGGTHNIWAPPFEHLQQALLPLVGQMGPKVHATLHRHGFYPAGGGMFTVEIEPAGSLTRLDLIHRGAILRQSARAVVSKLPLCIAQRELQTIHDRLGWPADSLRAEAVESPGPGNCLTLEIVSEHLTEVFTGFGQKGVPAETVAAAAADEAARYLAAGVPVGEHLADQLLLPMALAAGGSFRTLAPSTHATTNAQVIRQFLDVEIRGEQLSEDVWQITLERAFTAEHAQKAEPESEPRT